tara:strand:+ start:390 stop:647 length:258 start_codon:yes stop_codon:yes gene_type:complete
MENNMTKKRARTEDGKFIADDPSTPDVNEAYEQEAKPEVPQTYVITLETLNKVVNVLGQLDYKSVFQLMEELRGLQAVTITKEDK